jgi:hypothetical protein
VTMINWLRSLSWNRSRAASMRACGCCGCGCGGWGGGGRKQEAGTAGITQGSKVEVEVEWPSVTMAKCDREYL